MVLLFVMCGFVVFLLGIVIYVAYFKPIYIVDYYPVTMLNNHPVLPFPRRRIFGSYTLARDYLDSEINTYILGHHLSREDLSNTLKMKETALVVLCNYENRVIIHNTEDNTTETWLLTECKYKDINKD